MSIKLFPSQDPIDKRDFIYYITFFFGLLPATKWGSSDFVLLLLTALGIFHIYIIQKSTIDRVFFYVLFFWIFINLLSWIILGSHGFKITTFVGSCLKLFLGYNIMKLCRDRFVLWFEHLIFLLACVSLVGFTIQLINYKLFYYFPYNFAEAGRMSAGHWNTIIFNFSTYHVSQNSGFVGEPGTFGYYIGMAMVMNLILNKGKLNNRFVFLGVAGLTSVSTNFYITLLIFVVYFLIKLPPSLKLIMGLFLIPIVFTIYQLPFISEKLNDYLDKSDNFQNATVVKSDRINRMAIFLNDINDISHYPLGHGVNEAGLSRNVFGRVITGTNGISRLGVRYGVFGVFFFLIVYFKLIDRLNLKIKGNFLLTIIILMYITANPMERDYSAMSLFWLYFLTNEEDIRRLIKNYDKQKLLRLDLLKKSKEPVYRWVMKNKEELKHLSEQS